MILEPIRDFETADYELPLAMMAKESQLTDILKSIEEKKRRFYSEASVKIEFLIEASTVFEQFADECETNLEAIEKLT